MIRESLRALIGWGGRNEIEHEMAAGPLCCRWNHHHDFPNLLSLPSLFRRHAMWTELCQGHSLVCNLACLLGDPVELAVGQGCAAAPASDGDS